MLSLNYIYIWNFKVYPVASETHNNWKFRSWKFGFYLLPAKHTTIENFVRENLVSNSTLNNASEFGVYVNFRLINRLFSSFNYVIRLAQIGETNDDATPCFIRLIVVISLRLINIDCAHRIIRLIDRRRMNWLRHIREVRIKDATSALIWRDALIACKDRLGNTERLTSALVTTLHFCNRLLIMFSIRLTRRGDWRRKFGEANE